MGTMEVLNRLRTVFDDVFEGQGGIITESTTANDIEDWDSLTNIELMVAVEENFGLQFTSADVSNFRNVGDLVRAIQAKISV